MIFIFFVKALLVLSAIKEKDKRNIVGIYINHKSIIKANDVIKRMACLEPKKSPTSALEGITAQ